MPASRRHRRDVVCIRTVGASAVQIGCTAVQIDHGDCYEVSARAFDWHFEHSNGQFPKVTTNSENMFLRQTFLAKAIYIYIFIYSYLFSQSLFIDVTVKVPSGSFGSAAVCKFIVPLAFNPGILFLVLFSCAYLARAKHAMHVQSVFTEALVRCHEVTVKFNYSCAPVLHGLEMPGLH